MTTINIEERVAKAASLFKQGYNCAQAVVMAYADLYHMDETFASHVSASFGGGIGRMRETCGAACGMAVLAGMDCGSAEAGDREGKSENYRVVQQLMEQFRQLFGTLTCAELLKLKRDTPLSFDINCSLALTLTKFIPQSAKAASTSSPSFFLIRP